MMVNYGLILGFVSSVICFAYFVVCTYQTRKRM